MLELSPYTPALVLSVFFAAFVTASVWRERPKPGAAWLAGVDVAVGCWGVGGLLTVSATSAELQQFGDRLALAAVMVIPVFFLLFTLGYTGHRERLTRPLVAILVAESTLVAALVVVDHGLVAPGAQFDAGETFITALQLNLLGVHYLYANALALFSEYLLVRQFLASRNVYRRRTLFFLLLLSTLHFTHLLTLFGLSPTPGLTLTPLGFVVFGAVSALVMSGYRNLSFLPLERLLTPFEGYSKTLTPLARNQAIEETSTGFFVLDHEGTVVDVNPAAKEIVPGEIERVVGKSLSTISPPEIFVDGVPGYMHVESGETVNRRFDGIWIDTGDQRRCFDVLVSSLDDDSEVAGYVALVYDVTEREQRKQILEQRTQELRRQNDRLEDFAGIVSHDLRNPLNVASGRLELVDAGDDQEHVDEAKAAMGRMENIIDDVLTFARLGRTVDDTEAVSLPALAREAWSNVDTYDATLSVETDARIEASRSRLLRAFENLFRNAVEHGGVDVTVTVGALESGFFVADDGPGIPEDRREKVLEQGFTTNSEGTGFGLSIVREAIEAHGWEISVTESENGGARFEVRGLSPDARPVDASVSN